VSRRKAQRARRGGPGHAHAERRSGLRKFGSRSARSAVLALALTAVVALSACTPWRPTAAEVDGSEIRTSEVAGLSDVLRRDQAVTALIGSVVLGQSDPGEITDSRTLSDVSQFLLSQEIIDKVIRAEVARQGLTVGDAERQSAWNALGTTPEGFASAQPTAEGTKYIDHLVDQLAYRNALLATIPEDQRSTKVTELFSGADISVNPRFGRWDPVQLQVVPLPQAPAPSGS
jgi:hypothetical protein